MKNRRLLRNLNPTMTFLLLIVVTMFLSGVLSIFNFHTNYSTINPITNSYNSELVEVHNLFSLSGLKEIVTNAVSDFVSFAPLSMLIIVLIGVGIMEKTGFLKVFFTLLTKNMKKYTVTFMVVFNLTLSTTIIKKKTH